MKKNKTKKKTTKYGSSKIAYLINDNETKILTKKKKYLYPKIN